MAEIRELKSAIKKSFTEVDALKENLAVRVAEINKERDDYVNSEVLKVVSPEYLESHYRDIQEFSGTLDEFVCTRLSLEQKLEILTDYNINRQILEGNNGIEVKLDDIAKRKKDAKEQFKEEALELVSMYQTILDENKSRISLIEQDISTIKKQLETAENKLQEIMGKDDESIAFAGRVSGKFDKAQAMASMKEQIESLKTDLEIKQKELQGLQQLQRKYMTELNARKVEIQTFLKAQNIYAFERAANTNSDTSKENANENISDKEQRTEQVQQVKDKPKQIAKSMFKDFMEAPPERQRKLLRLNGNEEILKMARRLGPFDRRRLETIMNQRMEELKYDSIVFTANDGTQITVTKEEMKSMRNMKEETLRVMREELDRFNQDFSKKNIEEIEEFEGKLDYIRIGSILNETSSKFGAIARFLNGFSKKENSIYELAKSAARYANLKSERTAKKEEMLDRLRAKVGRKPMDEYTKESTIKQLDRTGADEFHR